MNESGRRIDWIDCARGIGIILVVAGHVWSGGGRYIFWFHMPLFFFISGLLYKPTASAGHYAAAKAGRLLVPYFSFLFLLSIPDYRIGLASGEPLDATVALTEKLLYGGRDLYGWFDVFWFVTCLFCTHLAFDMIHRSGKNRRVAVPVIVCGMFAYATAGQYLPFIRLPLFWGVNVVPMALLFYYMGHISGELLIRKKTLVFSALLVLGVFVLLDRYGIVTHELKMKWEAYGVAVVNVVLATCGIVLVVHLALVISRIAVVNTIFSCIGKASLVIMFLHQAVRQVVVDRIHCITNALAVILVTVACCCAVYAACTVLPASRLLFLGEVTDRNRNNNRRKDDEPAH